MNSHTLIEPVHLLQFQMNHSSKVYERYHFFLKSHSNERAAELTKEYCMKTPFYTVDDQLACFEFLYMNDYIIELETILHSKNNHPDPSSLYEMLIKRREKAFSLHELQEFEALIFKHPSLKCLHLFIMIYMYYDLKRYTALDKYIDLCCVHLLAVKEPLFYYYMNLRFDELSFHHYWKTNNLILARKYAFKYISKAIAPQNLSAMHLNLSLTYVFEDYDSSMYHADQALKIADIHGLSSITKILKNNTIPFIAAFHYRTDNMTTSDLVETAHIALAENEWDKARSILTSLPTLTPFQESYLGLATQNSKILRRAHERFVEENGDLFFAMLPKLYLKRLN
ncbi:AimR family lysis-lysogeny pheromone receptor [Halobacillus sp. B23F22_1]|uniref:AimR family lysis-lysogeny pheromone receptor n=1 Tax=Halobacillus sp. B23F22_1 TaxID=3459514 RepID=UPI00373EE154